MVFVIKTEDSVSGLDVSLTLIKANIKHDLLVKEKNEWWDRIVNIKLIKQHCTQCEIGQQNLNLIAEVERLKVEKKNNPWCLKCKEPDCLIESDGTCSMIKIYLEVTK